MKNAVAACKGLTTILGLAALSLGGSPVVYAQEGALEEIIVTARYREEKLQETPIAITAITAEDMQVRGFSNSYQIAYSVPNASFRQTQAAFGNSMSAFIRGIGQYDFLGEFEPGVGMYFDDVLHPMVMGSSIDLLDLERVEVLRGPQGTLFGRGSIGGAVRYVSKRPEGDNTGSIQVTTGSFDRVDLRGSYDFGITENLFARVTGVSKSRDGHQDVIDFACDRPAQAGTIPQQIFNREADCKLGTQGGEDVTGVRGALRWIVNDDLELSLTSDYQNDNSEARADTLAALIGPSGAFANWSANYLVPNFGVPYDSRFIPPNIYTTYATYEDPRSGLSFEPKTALEQWGISGKADWNFNDQVRAEAILSHREFDGKFATDADGSPFNEQTVDGVSSFESFTAELRFSGRLWDRLDWTLGYFHYDGEFTGAQNVSIPAFIFNGVFNAVVAAGVPPAVAAGIAAGVIDNNALFLVNALNITDSENNSGFAHGVYDFNDKLSFTAGVRYSGDKKDENFDNTIVQAELSTSETSFDWKVGLDYKLTEDILGYGSIATGYRPQAFNPRPFQVTQFVQVDGDEATSYELGVKADLFDRRVRMNIAGFYIDYSKRILPIGGIECLLIPGSDPPTYNTVPPGTPGAITDTLGNTCLAVTSRTFYDNIPAKVTGVEIEGQWRPVDALTISGIFGFTNFEGDEQDDPSLLGATTLEVLDDRPIYVPEINWSVAAAYEFGMGNGSTLTPRIDVYGQTEICPSIATVNAVTGTTVGTVAQRCAEGYELVNVRLEWASPDRTWTVAAGGNNVTDEEYYHNKFDLTGFGQPTIEGQPGRPIEWFVTVGRNF